MRKEGKGVILTFHPIYGISFLAQALNRSTLSPDKYKSPNLIRSEPSFIQNNPLLGLAGGWFPWVELLIAVAAGLKFRLNAAHIFQLILEHLWTVRRPRQVMQTTRNLICPFPDRKSPPSLGNRCRTDDRRACPPLPQALSSEASPVIRCAITSCNIRYSKLLQLQISQNKNALYNVCCYHKQVLIIFLCFLLRYSVNSSPHQSMLNV